MSATVNRLSLSRQNPPSRPRLNRLQAESSVPAPTARWIETTDRHGQLSPSPPAAHEPTRGVKERRSSSKQQFQPLTSCYPSIRCARSPESNPRTVPPAAQGTHARAGHCRRHAFKLVNPASSCMKTLQYEFLAVRPARRLSIFPFFPRSVSLTVSAGWNCRAEREFLACRRMAQHLHTACCHQGTVTHERCRT